MADQNHESASVASDVATQGGASTEGTLMDPSGAPVASFVDMVKQMCVLQDQMKTMAAERRKVAAEMKEMQGQVMEYMIEHNVARCNYNDDEIFVNRREKKGSVTKALLKRSFLDYFGQDGEADAEELFNFVIEEAGCSEVKELKRCKRKRTAVAEKNG